MWLVTLFWGVMAIVSVFQAYSFYAGIPESPPVSLLIYLAIVFSVLWALATPLIFVLATRFPLERQTLTAHLPLHLLFSLLVGVGHRVIWLHFSVPALQPSFRMQWVWTDLVTSFEDQAMVYWVILAVHQGVLYYGKYQEGKQRAAQLETQLMQAQLAGLKMQLQPHFLFNTLHTIHSLLDVRSDHASEMIVRLSEFLRHSLENTGEQEVSLERELDFIELYLEIERTRFEERLRVEYEIEADTLQYLVPNFLLQPLVENAVRHGISQLPRGGTLRISVFQGNGNLSIFVANSGSFLSSDPLRGTRRTGIGVANTKARLRALYGDNQSFLLRNWSEGGVEVAIQIPARTASENFEQLEGETLTHESAYRG